MLSDYVTWWAEQMLQWIPARFVARDRPFVHALIATPFEDDRGETAGVALSLRRQQREQQLGQFELIGGLAGLQAAVPARGRPPAIVLRLPPSLLLEREVVLPLAAEREPERVIAYEMDRLTPFASNEVFWTYAIARRDRGRGRLHLRLSLVTKAAVQTLLTALTQAGLGPTVLEIGEGGAARHITLHQPNSQRARFVRCTLAGATIVCGALAAATVVLPFVLQSVASRQIEARIEALKPRVAEAEALRRSITARAAGSDVVVAERERVGDVLAVLAAVTDRLPDDTYLTDFTLRQGKFTLNGQSAVAVRLIAALSGDPVIRNPEFMAPVTRIDGRTDLFAIRAEVAP